MSIQDHALTGFLPRAAVLRSALLCLGTIAPAFAGAALVEGVAMTGTGTSRVGIDFSCDGPDCRFEAVLEGVSADDVTEYEWQFGDGRALTTADPVASHRWTAPGPQTVTLLVHDQYCDPLIAEAGFSTLASPTAPESTDGGATSPSEGGTLTVASVRLGQDPTRRVSEPLQGATVSGGVFVFVEGQEGAERVVFRLSGAAFDDRVLGTENSAPFDMVGGTHDSANPFDTRALVDGAYRLDVVATYPSGHEDVVSVDFAVRNATVEPIAEAPSEEPPASAPVDSPDAPPIVPDEPTVGAATPDESDPVVTLVGELVFSTRRNRAGGDALAGAIVRDDIYPRMDGADGARRIRFFLDDPAMRGEPLNVDRRAPWDAVGGSKRRARALDTRLLENGRHTLSAKVIEADRSYVVHAVFTVAN